LKEKTAEMAHLRDPTFMIRHAVKGMLPKNNRKNYILERLHIFPEAKHTFEAQNPIPVDLLGKDAVFKELRY
jgi:large subunit ribosomal protein L13